MSNFYHWSVTGPERDITGYYYTPVMECHASELVEPVGLSRCHAYVTPDVTLEK
jgi:hypothetical protein